MPTKSELRKQIRQARRQQPDPAGASEQICRQLVALPEWNAARTVLFYVNAGAEVRTQTLLQTCLSGGIKVCLVPRCSGRELELWQVENWSELAPGAFGVLEPAPAVLERSARLVPPQAVDLALIPGVAFDPQGNRLGQGQGYYDRLLSQLAPGCLRLGLAYTCQVVPEVPAESHDQRVDAVLSEQSLIRCSQPE